MHEALCRPSSTTLDMVHAEDGPPITQRTSGLVMAIEAGAPQVWPEAKNNLVFDWEVGDKTATDAEFADAAHITKLTVVNNRVVVASMEERAAFPDYDRASRRWTLYTNTQGGWLIKDLLGSVFATEPE